MGTAERGEGRQKDTERHKMPSRMMEQGSESTLLEKVTCLMVPPDPS